MGAWLKHTYPFRKELLEVVIRLKDIVDGLDREDTPADQLVILA